MMARVIEIVVIVVTAVIIGWLVVRELSERTSDYWEEGDR